MYLDFGGETLGHGALFLIPDQRLLFQREQKTHESIDCPIETGGIPGIERVSVEGCCL